MRSISRPHAFDLADRLQTPIFVMLDLDIGMQDWLTRAASHGTTADAMDRGKVMTAEELEAGHDFGRYLDVDGDGIPYRTLSGHACHQGQLLHARHDQGSLRALHGGGAGVRRQHAAPAAQVRDREVDRCPRPIDPEGDASPRAAGVIWFGSTGAAMEESLAALELDGIHLDRMRLRAFPFADAVSEFIAAHDRVFVVEQNRDAQMKALLVNECGIDPSRLISVLHYDGTPITARFITREIAEKARLFNVTPLRKVGAA